MSLLEKNNSFTKENETSDLVQLAPHTPFLTGQAEARRKTDSCLYCRSK